MREMLQRKTPVHLPARDSFNLSVIIFVTVCTQDRKPFLARQDIHELLRSVWSVASHWLVGRYVLMPDHIHFFCAPSGYDYQPLAKWVQFWKSLASQMWPRPEEQPIWQKSFWDTQLRRGERFGEKWEYVRQNPVRKRLVVCPEDWPYQGEMNIFEWHET
jgi:putative transposase